MEKLNRWKDYEIRFEFKNLEKQDEDIQMILYMDEQVVYTSKKHSFKRTVIKTTRLKLNKIYLPYYVPIDKEILIWTNDKEHERFLNFCRKFRLKTCIRLQDELKIKQCNPKKP